MSPDDEFKINAPPTFIFDGVRFVFFTALQKVAESFDHLPAFKLEIANVTPGVGSVSWPLYVSTRIGNKEEVNCDEQRFLSDPTSPEERERCRTCAKELLAYIRKHYGKKVQITLCEPAFSEWLDDDAREEWRLVQAGEPSKVDFTLVALTELMIWILGSATLAVGDTKETRLSIARTSDDADYVKFDITGIGDWEFVMRNDDGEKRHSDTVHGTAQYKGRPVRFYLHSRVYQYTIHVDEMQKFMTSNLVEEVVNKAYNDILNDPANPNQVAISDVTIDPFWNQE